MIGMATCPGNHSIGHSVAERGKRRGHFESAIKQQAEIESESERERERERRERRKGRGERSRVCANGFLDIFLSWTGCSGGQRRRHGIKLFEMIHLKAKWKVESATENCFRRQLGEHSFLVG